MNLANADKVTATVASNASGGKITLHADTPESEPIATIDVPVTGPVTYTIDHTEIEVTELGYVHVQAQLTKKLTGVHDVYVVFHAPDLRIDSLAFERKAANASKN